MISENTGIIGLVSGVLSPLSALVWHGLTNMYDNFILLETNVEEAHEIPLFALSYIYTENIDKENFIEPCEINEDLLVPSMERALVTYMMYETAVEDDENLMHSLQEYTRMMEGDLSDLLEVADFYGVRENMVRAAELSVDFDSEY